MRRFSLIIGLVTAAILVGGVFLLSRQSSPEDTLSSNISTSLPENYEYFWGEGCPHCANVDEFLSLWEKKDQVKIDKKEVYRNRENANLLSQRATSCGIPKNQVGVPLLFTPEGECLVGDEPIIDHFKVL